SAVDTPSPLSRNSSKGINMKYPTSWKKVEPKIATRPKDARGGMPDVGPKPVTACPCEGGKGCSVMSGRSRVLQPRAFSGAHAWLRFQNGVNHLGKSGATFAGGHVPGVVAQQVPETRHVGHAHAVFKMAKHARIVGGIAHINPSVEFRVEVAPQA